MRDLTLHDMGVCTLVCPLVCLVAVVEPKAWPRATRKMIHA
jgi:hypothetical protein